MSEISSSDAANLAALLTSAASGRAVDGYASRLGAASKLMLQPTGVPRTDGLALTTILLRESIGAFASSTKAWFNAPHTPHQIGAVVSSLWGIGAAPLTAAELAAQNEVSPATVRRWATTVLEDVAFLRRLNEASAQLPSPLDTSVDAVILRWAPPSTDWPPANTHRSMTSRARTILKSMPPGLDDAGVIEVLREAVVARLQDYYSSAHHALELRHFAAAYMAPWRLRTTRFIPQKVPVGHADPAGERRRLVDGVAVVVQTSFYLLMRNAPEERRFLEQANQERQSTARTLEILATAPPAPRAGSPTPLTHAELANAEAAASRRPSHRGEAWEARGQLRPTAAELLTLANEIRSLSRLERRTSVDEYLARRVLIDEQHISELDGLLVALADQSVHLDIVELGSAELLRRASAVANGNRASQARWAYEILDLRNFALLIKKGGDYRGALRALRTAYDRTIYLLDRYRAFDQGRRFVEVHQQIALALAGYFINLSELLLATVPAPDLLVRTLPLAEQWVRTALSELQALERGGLPSVRHADGHISSTSWRVQTRVMHIRVLLLRYIAQESYPLRIGAAERIDLLEVEPLFRELLRLSDLRPGASADIVSLAVWWAFLNDGEVPAEARLSPALRHLWFMDGDPATLGVGGGSYATVDLDGATVWLDVRGQDAGVVNHLDAASSIYWLLDERSGRRFHAWRTSNPPRHAFPA